MQVACSRVLCCGVVQVSKHTRHHDYIERRSVVGERALVGESREWRRTQSLLIAGAM